VQSVAQLRVAGGLGFHFVAHLHDQCGPDSRRPGVQRGGREADRPEDLGPDSRAVQRRVSVAKLSEQ
jgi:hypothetical protein